MPTQRESLLHSLLLCAVLLTGAYFRFSGLMWGDEQYQHPDERFLVWVTADIQQVKSVGEYFDTRQSTLNPANRGHGFFVYGTLPVFATRLLADASYENPGWAEILQVGRSLSALADLLTVLLVYAIAARIAGRWAGLLAAVFSAAAVLQIQQAHFYTVDSFATTFTTLAVYMAVRIAAPRPVEEPSGGGLWRHVPLWSALFGAAVGMAMACKVNTAPVAALLPAAIGLRFVGLPIETREKHLARAIGYLVLGGAAALIMFRLLQPYAFTGPSPFNFLPDPDWVRSIREQRAQAAGDIDFPPALQWARRGRLFSFQNLTVWGLGLPLGVLAWTAFLGMAWTFLREGVRRARAGGPRSILGSPWPAAILVWGWTAFYFTWQSAQWNPTMRYQLPIYPTLAVLAAWGVAVLARAPKRDPILGRASWLRPLSLGAGLLVAVLTLAWAFAFAQIFQRTETRQAASEWIYSTFPGPVNLELESGLRLLSVDQSYLLRPDAPYAMQFVARQSGLVTELALPQVRIPGASESLGEMRLDATVWDLETGTQAAVAQTWALPGDAWAARDLFFEPPLSLVEGRRYALELALTGPDPTAGAAQVELAGQVTFKIFTPSAGGGLIEGIDLSSRPPVYRYERGGVVRVVILRAESQRRASASEAIVTVEDTVTRQQRSAAARLAPGSTAPVYRVDPPLTLAAGRPYAITFQPVGLTNPQAVIPPPELIVVEGESQWQSLPPFGRALHPAEPWTFVFQAERADTLNAVTLWRASRQGIQAAGPAQITARLVDPDNASATLAEAIQEVGPSGPTDARGAPVRFAFDPPVQLLAGRSYLLRLEAEDGLVFAYGSAPANESDWDMGLPFRGQGYDGYGGIYQRDLNFQMYWDDNPEKYQRFVDTLDQADAIFLSSNRQWGTTTRIPERYPLTTAFYRLLMGCPSGLDVVRCYNGAEVGDYSGELGFDLVRVFTSYPNLGPLRINTQYAEEAFTVYDHPKVFLFRKRADYDPERVRAALGAVDLTQAAHLTPRKAACWRPLTLPADRWARQRSGVAWAALFPPGSILNRSQPLAAAAWWVFLAVLGWITYPLARLALPGLGDGGYPLARVLGLLLLSYPVWLAGSAGVTVTRSLVGVALLLLAAAGAAAFARQRSFWGAELRDRWRYYAGVEGLALYLYLIFLLVRLTNPDLWHVVFGGEKPMDFSYFNAVLKSTTFPPYDPWFAGGTMNYYYYGFVLVGMPVKLLGITPSVAYNLILPALFSLTALTAFSIGLNLNARIGWRAGLPAALFLVILGNQGVPRMVWQGWQRLVAPPEAMAAASGLEKIAFAAQGAARNLRGEALPYPEGDWYWVPSRAIIPAQGGEITEFPLFSFLYADLHAHLIALPLTLLVIAWGISVVLARGRWRSTGAAAWGVLVGALAVGMLRAANAWDHPTYLALAILALIYSRFRLPGSPAGSPTWRRAAEVFLVPVAFLALSFLVAAPFNAWFRQGYNEIKPWDGPHANLSSYLVHWGLFLFVLAAWVFAELVDWMAQTPLSALKRLEPVSEWLALAGLAAAAVFVWMVMGGIAAAWVAVPLGLGCLILLFRVDQPESKRVVLLLAGAGLALTLAVEVIALQGDRMNTVFKFYYQAWTLLALSAAAALGWLLPKRAAWGLACRMAFGVALGALVAGASLTTLSSVYHKMIDRETPEAPYTLDGMTYMAYTRMLDGPPGGEGRFIDLSADYEAIRWMQEQVKGTPVLLEAHTPEYRHWGNRFTIYTGLPGVLGWENHQRQQRATTPAAWIDRRRNDIQDFYMTQDRALVVELLERYSVDYIVVGELERLYYPGEGLAKFTEWSGVLWDPVYSNGQTEIYRVK